MVDTEAVSEALGFELDAGAWALLCKLVDSIREPRPSLELMISVLERAVASVNGVAWERLIASGNSAYVLAVVHDDGLTVGVGHARGSKLLETAWPSLAGWKPLPHDNSELAWRWALERGDDRVTLRPRAGNKRHDTTMVAGFLEAIHAARDDDQPRLVFADWLMERGDVHGELIRLQLDAEKTPPSRYSKSRETQILASDTARIAGELAPYLDAPPFRRGFVECVRMTPDQFAHDGDRLFATYPLQTWVVAGEDLGTREITTVAAARGLSRVWRIEFTHRDAEVSRAPLAPLAKGQFTSLHAMGFTKCGHSGEDWFELFSKLDAPELQFVDFNESYSHPLMLLGLATNPKLTKLSNIDDWALEDLGDDQRGTFMAAMRALADQRPTLKSLTLSRSRAHDDETLHPLFALSSRVELETFDIDGSQLSDESLRAWQRGGRLGQLKSLSIRDAHFTPEAIADFIDAGCLPKLEQLIITTWDELRWDHDGYELVYEALLALPKTAPLKKLTLPPGRRGYDRLWERISRRFEVTE